MGGNTNTCQFSKARVLTTVQRTGEKARWCAGTKFAYWQRNAVHYYQLRHKVALHPGIGTSV
jgi:hypothetical protein